MWAYALAYVYDSNYKNNYLSVFATRRSNIFKLVQRKHPKIPMEYGPVESASAPERQAEGQDKF